ncbi:MAG: hypothetical protein CMN32_14730 [Saprospirales bacterium]|nr:hypothetical protein [Saprospirales bacterium]
MNRKVRPVYGLFWAMLAAYLFLSFSSNPPNGFTGAPPTFNTCSSANGGCHSGGTGMGNVMISGLPVSIMPNTTYPITVTVTRTNAVPQLAGFQMVALDASNNNVGTLSNPGPGSTIQTSGGRTYHEHNPAQPYTNNMATFTVDWTSPSSGNGTITMYAAANLANGNGGTSGDAIVTTTSSGNFMGGGGPITVVVTGTNVSCFGGSNGTATAMASGGGGGPYNYAWSNGGNTQTITNLSAGSYTVTVTNGAGGMGTGSITITQPPMLTVSIVSQTNITCFTPVGNATAQAAGGVGNYTYNWSTGASGATAILPAGNHSVTATDGNGCMATATVTILSNTTPPIAEAGPSMNITCTNSTVQLDGTGSSTGAEFAYLWTTSDGLIISGANTLNPTVGSIGTYTLTVTNTNNGCTSSDNTSVGINVTPPVADAGPDMELDCLTTTATLDGTGSTTGANISYQWTTTDGNIVSGANTLTPEVDAAGTYCLTVTDNDNGCTDSDCVVVTENITLPVASAGPDKSLTCDSTVITLDGSGSSAGPNISYNWTTPDGNIVSGQNGTNPLVDAAGTYVIVVANSANGCSSSDTVQVTLDTVPPLADAGPAAQFTCASSEAILDGSASSGNGPLAFQWSGPGIVGNSDTSVIIVNDVGTYFLTVTDSLNGCSATDSTTVTELTGPTVTIADTTHVLCHGDSTGAATAQGSGSLPPYSFAWSNGDSTATVSNLTAGTYTVILTDSLGCTDTASVTIEEPAQLQPEASATPETAAGANDGTATANPSGGVPPYSYAWSTGDTSQTITNLAPGNYTISVTDANSCVASQTVTVNAFDCSGFVLEVVSTAPLCHGDSTGMMEALPSSGTAPYAFSWSTGDTTSSVENLPAGTYSVTVTDANQCVLTETITLSQPAALVLSVVSQQDVSCNGLADGEVTVAAAGGTPGYTYLWNTGDTTATVGGLAAGFYAVTASDENGCETSLIVPVAEPPVLELAISITHESSVGAADGTASATPAGGTSPYQFLWSTGDTSQSITNLAPGTYCATLTDANGCNAEACGTVNQFGCDSLQVEIEVTNIACAGAESGELSAIVSGAAEPVQYAWSNGANGQTVTALPPGEYQITVTDANGCSLVQAATISEPDSLFLSVASGNVECPGGTVDTTSVMASGGTEPYTYLWSTGDSSQVVFDLGAGDYSVTVSDANGCTSSADFGISVLPDTVPPVAIAKDITIELDENGMAVISPQMIDDGSSDNCGIDTLVLDKLVFNCDDVGENTVILTAIDQDGNSSSDGATITVVDNLKPVFDCPESFGKFACDSTMLEFDIPTATDNCGPVTLVQVEGLPPGSIFPPGQTLMRFDATDPSGNKALCVFTLTVELAPVNVTLFAETPACHGDSTGTIELDITGLFEPYEILWNTGDTGTLLTGLPAGNYSVTVTNQLGCDDQIQVTLTEPSPLHVSIDTVIHEELGDLDPHKGAIQVTAQGGKPPYTYAWFQNGQFFSSQEDLDELDGNNYFQLELTDANGCIFLTDSIFVDFLVPVSTILGSGSVRSYPSPASSVLTVELDLPRLAPVDLQLLDAKGTPVWRLERLQVKSAVLDIPVADLPDGIYFLRIGVEGEWGTQSVIIARE